MIIKNLSLYIILLFSLLQNVIASPVKLMVLGDSLSAGYEMPIESSWPSLLAKELNSYDITSEVINVSISGDTTANGLARLPSLLDDHSPDYIIIELGANDGLRGFNPDLIKSNLVSLVELSQKANVDVALVEIMVPPNYGKRYSDRIKSVYLEIQKEHDVHLIPFFLAPIILDHPDWIKSDGLHPKEEAQPFIARFVAASVADDLTKSN